MNLSSCSKHDVHLWALLGQPNCRVTQTSWGRGDKASLCTYEDRGLTISPDTGSTSQAWGYKRTLVFN